MEKRSGFVGPLPVEWVTRVGIGESDVIEKEVTDFTSTEPGLRKQCDDCLP